jgi:ABC-2 type transport system permease protein
VVILKYEMKQFKNSVIVWSVALAGAIMLLLPVFISLMTDSTVITPEMISSFGSNPFFKAIGVDITSLLTPMGAYSYVTSFVLIAAATFGSLIGISLISKEYSQKTADFLLTKPHSRRSVFISKLFAGALCCIIVGFIYLAASYLAIQVFAEGSNELVPLLLIAFSVTLIQLLYMAVGLLLVVFVPNIKTPLIVALSIAFFTYTFGSFGRIIGNKFVTYLSPYTYFSGAYIREFNSYDLKYLLLFFVVLTISILVSYKVFANKDIFTV